jgi:hypothetical protein
MNLAKNHKLKAKKARCNNAENRMPYKREWWGLGQIERAVHQVRWWLFLRYHYLC